MSGGRHISFAELSAGGSYFLILLSLQYLIIDFQLTTNTFLFPGLTDYGRIGIISVVFAAVSVVVLGYLGENWVGRLAPQMILWIGFAAVGFLMNQFTVGFVFGMTLVVFATTFLVSGFHSLLDR